MPLLDHFHRPVADVIDWNSFHSGWATFIAAELNRLLPSEYRAHPSVKYDIQIDVGVTEQVSSSAPNGMTAVITYTAPVATFTAPTRIIEDSVEVQVFKLSGSKILVGAIELVSPSNKDRGDSRSAFVNKCAHFVQQGIGTLIVDIVTERKANLHNELIQRMLGDNQPVIDAHLYATAYHLTRPKAEALLEAWVETLKLGSGLPTLPLWLLGGLCVPVDLNSTYERTCVELRAL